MTDHVLTISVPYSSGMLDSAMIEFTNLVAAHVRRPMKPSEFMDEFKTQTSMLHQALLANDNLGCTILLTHLSAMALAAAVECAK